MELREKMELAEKIRKQTHILQSMINDAVGAHIKVEVATWAFKEIQNKYETPILEIRSFINCTDIEVKNG